MDYIEREFLKSEQIQPWIWFRYTDDIFFMWIASEKNRLNSFHPTLMFTHERCKESLNFVDAIVKILQPSPQNEKNMKKSNVCLLRLLVFPFAQLGPLEST